MTATSPITSAAHEDKLPLIGGTGQATQARARSAAAAAATRPRRSGRRDCPAGFTAMPSAGAGPRLVFPLCSSLEGGIPPPSGCRIPNVSRS